MRIRELLRDFGDRFSNFSAPGALLAVHTCPNYT